MILLSLLFQTLLGWSKESRILSFTEKEIPICGRQLSWGNMIAGLTNKERECLDSLASWDLSSTENGPSQKSSESKTIYTSISRDLIINQFKKGRTECLENVELVIPNKIKIKSENQLSLASLEPWIQSELALFSVDKKVEISRISLPKVDCQLAKQIQWNSLKIEGKNQFRFMLFVDDHNHWVTGEYRLLQKVPVLTKNLAPNEKIDSSDLEMQFKDTTFVAGYAQRMEDLVGRTAQQGISQGSLIEFRFLKVENLIEKGQIIQVQFQGDNFVVASQAQAEQSGGKGDLIKIKNLESQKTISAIVLGKGLVEVK